MMQRKAFGILWPILLGFAVLFAALATFGCVTLQTDFSSREYYVDQIERFTGVRKEASALAEFYDDREDGDYSQDADALASAGDAMSDWMRTCRQAIQQYDALVMRNTVFTVLSVLSAIASAVFLVLFIKARSVAGEN